MPFRIWEINIRKKTRPMRVKTKGTYQPWLPGFLYSPGLQELALGSPSWASPPSAKILPTLQLPAAEGPRF